MRNEIVQKKIEKNIAYFEDIYNNKEQYKAEWAFEDAQSKLDNFVKEYKCSNCCTKKMNKKLSRKVKRNMMISQIFSKLHLGVTITETIISALFVLVVSEISHSVDALIASHTLSLYFLGIFALIKVLFENNYIRPAFERLSWRLYRYSYQTIYNLVNSNIANEQEDEVLETITAVSNYEVKYG